MLNEVSHNGVADIQIQIGSGSLSTSGYKTVMAYISGSAAQAFNYSSGFVVVNSTGAVYNYTGSIMLSWVSANLWVVSGNVGIGSGAAAVWQIAGVSPNLGGTLDRVSVNTVGGGASFDSGTINIQYE